MREIIDSAKNVVDTTFTDRLEVKNAAEKLEKAKQISRLREQIIGISQSFKECTDIIFELALHGEDMLIYGETGTGKTFLAELAHEISVINGRSGKFVVADLASAVTNDLFLSGLFGHVKGAFTGATATKKGLFDVASGGTILLDEIGILSQDEQLKLLRVIQHKEYVPVGGTEPRQTDALIISATNVDLSEAQKEGKFRSDLYFRLKTFAIHISPLRDRDGDIPILVSYFLKKAVTELNSRSSEKELTISTKALELLLQYQWPGNVRELENVIKRAAFFCKNDLLSHQDIKKALGYISVQSSRVSISGNIQIDLKTNEDKSEKTIEDDFLELEGAKEFKQDFPGITLGVSTMEALELYVRAGHIIVHLDEANRVITRTAELMGISANNLYIRIRSLREKGCDLSKKENFEDFPRPNAKIGIPINNLLADAKKRFLELVYRHALGNIDDILKLTGMKRHAFLFQARKYALRAHIIKPSDKETYTRRNAPFEQCSAEKLVELVEDQTAKIKSLEEKLFSSQEEYDELERANRNLNKTLSEKVVINFETITKLEKERDVAREKKEKAGRALSEFKKQVHSLIADSDK